jgi:hypothetical protein
MCLHTAAYADKDVELMQESKSASRKSASKQAHVELEPSTAHDAAAAKSEENKKSGRTRDDRASQSHGGAKSVTSKTPPSSSASGVKSGQEFVCATLVRMLFDDGVWYNGKVSSYDVRSKKYSIEFEDGDIQETALPDKEVEVLLDVPSNDTSCKSSSKSAGKRARADAGAEQEEDATQRKGTGAFGI